MKVFLTAFLVVMLAEMGDKTQLLAFSLTTRFRRPWPIMGGILTATLLNHALSAWGGSWVAEVLPARWMAAILSVSFLGFGIWTLIPDQYEGKPKPSRFGPYLTTTVTFFLVEIGDKTQLATMALGARFMNPWIVTAGTTLGMLVSDGLGVFLGEKIGQKISFKWIRWITAALFLFFGLWSAWSAWRGPAEVSL